MAGDDAHLHHPVGGHQHARQGNGLPGPAEEAPHRWGQPHHLLHHRIEPRGPDGVVGPQDLPRRWRPRQAVQLLLQPGQLGWMPQQGEQQATQGGGGGFVAGEQQQQQLLHHVVIGQGQAGLIQPTGQQIQAAGGEALAGGG